MHYRREIDGLRAVAVLPVILFHAGFGLFRGGFVGVDIFFVISGYLITSILIAEFERGNFSIARFYERRARRILPALCVVMLACLPLAYLWMLPSQLQDFAQSLVAVMLFASNILFWQQDGYFAAAAELKPLLHTWSLAVEEQYYLLFPVFLLVFWRFGRQRVFWAVVGATVLSLALAEWGWRHNPSANFYLAPTRAWELLVGSICAFLTVGKAQRSSNTLSMMGLALIVFAIFAYSEKTPFPSVYALVPVLGAALIILFAGQGTWVAQLLSLRGFVGIGLISYSAYLWHQPLFAFARLRSLTEPSHFVMAALAVASLGLAWASWSWVEQPFRRRANPVLATACLWQGGVIAALFVGIGVAGQLGKGFVWRLSAAEQFLYATAKPSPKRNECHFNPKSNLDTFPFCTFFGPNADVAVYGNSHGVELAYGLAQKLQTSSRAVAQFTISGCGPGLPLENDAYCVDFYTNRLQYMLNTPQLKYVVLAFRAESASAKEAAASVELANYLSAQGKKVVFVVQAPTLQMDISAYLRRSFLSGAQDVTARTRQEWRDINRVIYDALKGLSPNVSLFDLADYFCKLDKCFAVRDGQALYFDDDHMSIFGAKFVADDLVKRLQ